MWKIRGLIYYLLVLTATIQPGPANAFTGYCSCWDSGTSVSLGAHCWFREEYLDVSAGFLLASGAYCNYRCRANQQERNIDVYIFSYPDAHSYDVCSGNAIWKGKTSKNKSNEEKQQNMKRSSKKK